MTSSIGNPVVAIAEAFDMMPIAEVTLEVDIVMSSLLVSALNSDTAATLVLSYAIRHTCLDHPLRPNSRCRGSRRMTWNRRAALAFPANCPSLAPGR
jgi:hypothetical protein